MARGQMKVNPDENIQSAGAQSAGILSAEKREQHIKEQTQRLLAAKSGPREDLNRIIQEIDNDPIMAEAHGERTIVALDAERRVMATKPYDPSLGSEQVHNTQNEKYPDTQRVLSSKWDSVTAAIESHRSNDEPSL